MLQSSSRRPRARQRRPRDFFEQVLQEMEKEERLAAMATLRKKKVAKDRHFPTFHLPHRHA